MYNFVFLSIFFEAICFFFAETRKLDTIFFKKCKSYLSVSVGYVKNLTQNQVPPRNAKLSRVLYPIKILLCLNKRVGKVFFSAVSRGLFETSAFLTKLDCKYLIIFSFN